MRNRIALRSVMRGNVLWLSIVSLLTMVGGRAVYAAGPYEALEEKSHD